MASLGQKLEEWLFYKHKNDCCELVIKETWSELDLALQGDAMLPSSFFADERGLLFLCVISLDSVNLLLSYGVYNFISFVFTNSK